MKVKETNNSSKLIIHEHPITYYGYIFAGIIILIIILYTPESIIFGKTWCIFWYLFGWLLLMVLITQKHELVFDDQHEKLYFRNYILFNILLQSESAFIKYEDIETIRLEYHYWLGLKSYRLELHGDFATKYGIQYFKFMKGGLSNKVHLEVINQFKKKIKDISVYISK